jgi:hypothetical protein
MVLGRSVLEAGLVVDVGRSIWWLPLLRSALQMNIWTLTVLVVHRRLLHLLLLTWSGQRGTREHQAVAVHIGAGVWVDLLLDDWKVALQLTQIELWDLELSSVSKFEYDAFLLTKVFEQPHERQ